MVNNKLEVKLEVRASDLGSASYGWTQTPST